MRYICKNTDCAKFGVYEFLQSETYKYVSGVGMVGEHSNCPSCGQRREESNPNADIPLSEKNIGVNLFNGMSKEQKREALRQRAHKHYMSSVKERRDSMVNQAIDEMKNLKK